MVLSHVPTRGVRECGVPFDHIHDELAALPLYTRLEVIDICVLLHGVRYGDEQRLEPVLDHNRSHHRFHRHFHLHFHHSHDNPSYRNNASLRLVSKHKLRGIFLDVIVQSLQSRYSVDRQEDVALGDQSMKLLVLPVK